MASLDSFGAKSQLQVGEESFEFFHLAALGELNLPFTHRVLLENLLRTEDGANVTAEQIRTLAAWDASAAPSQERSSSRPRASSCRTSPVCRVSSTWPRCAKR